MNDLKQSEHKLLPIFLNLSQRDVLLVGAGVKARERLLQLVPSGARITVIAPESRPETQALIDEALRHESTQIRLIQRDVDVSADVVSGYTLVIAATNHREVNAAVIAQARALNILANSVDEPEQCDFYSAAVIDRGPIRVAISSEGRFPGFCTALRKTLETVLDDSHGESIEQLAALRDRFKREYADPQARNRILKAIAADVEARYFGLEKPDFEKVKTRV